MVQPLMEPLGVGRMPSCGWVFTNGPAASWADARRVAGPTCSARLEKAGLTGGTGARVPGEGAVACSTFSYDDTMISFSLPQAGAVRQHAICLRHAVLRLDLTLHENPVFG